MKQIHSGALFDPALMQDIRKKLLSRNETISVAESVTTGLLQTAIGSAPDASQFFQGGITVYNIGQKHRHLRVEPIHAIRYNCVSKQVAEEMAHHVCDLFSSQWGLGVTGYASPVPESGNLVFSHFAISYDHKIKTSRKIRGVGNDPFAVQLHYVHEIMVALRNVLR
ncbi:MAG TPA: CinA family protein [Puia sp.]|jgi:PncC family amidohydrolase|nr:CinA family protein [Puia sp.]